MIFRAFREHLTLMMKNLLKTRINLILDVLITENLRLMQNQMFCISLAVMFFFLPYDYPEYFSSFQ